MKNHDLGGVIHRDSPFRWVLEREPDVTTLGKLLTKFYDFNENDESCPFKPLGWARDPEHEGKPVYGHNVHVILAPYRKNFRIVIEKHFQSVTGPHFAKLLFQTEFQELLWVAGVQLDGLFWSDDTMRTVLVAALQNKELYQSEKTANTIVSI